MIVRYILAIFSDHGEDVIEITKVEKRNFSSFWILPRNAEDHVEKFLLLLCLVSSTFILISPLFSFQSLFSFHISFLKRHICCLNFNCHSNVILTVQTLFSFHFHLHLKCCFTFIFWNFIFLLWTVIVIFISSFQMNGNIILYMRFQFSNYQAV